MKLDKIDLNSSRTKKIERDIKYLENILLYNSRERHPQLTTIVELEATNIVLLLPNVYQTPVWLLTLWNTYQKNLPFMSDVDGEYPDKRYEINNILVDYDELRQISSYDDCFKNTNTWFLDDNRLFIHYKDDSPPFKFRYLKNGFLYGFTNSKPLLFEMNEYLPELLESQEIEESTDIHKYSRMQFDQASYALKNDTKFFDTLPPILGNEFNVLCGMEGSPRSEYKPLRQYFIENYQISLEKAVFSVKDKRERLSFMAPNEVYTMAKYPYIADTLVDKTIQDAYGICSGIPGVCIDENKMFTDTTYTKLVTHRYFKFARHITSLSLIEVKMSDKWTKIYPPDETSASWYMRVINPADGTITIVPVDVEIDSADGIIGLPIAQAHAEGNIQKGVNSVRANGIFNPQTKPGDIIADILGYYGNIPFVDSNINISEWHYELQSLTDIGLFIDSQKDGYEWIEEIQGKSIIGFQLLNDFDRFTVRLDNPNRDESFNIDKSEIINLKEVEIDYSGEYYATYAEIGYEYNYSEKTYKKVINKKYQELVMAKHRIENVYNNISLLPDRESAEIKSEMVLRDIMEIRPVLRNIKLFGLNWFDLRIYDIGHIDFSLNIQEIATTPKAIISLIHFLNDEKYKSKAVELSKKKSEAILLNSTKVNKRNFLGEMRCQILRCARDPLTGITTIDVRQRERILLEGDDNG
jgi:hypothetical protein